ncbi:conserved membrane hypothetical protein [Roseovarius sp. EC-HK134]|nr:conserved membrane hypothetical protein [Roseovarius sp. EC-HK134]VVT10729.1 conserved membrane hypothetical protein [Roseovarius sp. EC-SD190]
MIALLHGLARQGRLMLVLGLVVGILAPRLAKELAPFIFPMIVFLLFLSTLRVDVLRAFPAWADVPGYLGITLMMQVAFPMGAIGLLAVMGALTSILGIGMVLVLAAAPLTGSPGLTLMVGGDPAPALRQLIIGTMLLPLTVLPVFWVMPVFGSPAVVAIAAAKLLGVIAVAGGLGLILRRCFSFFQSFQGERAVEGLITVVMTVVVVGLMSAVGPALLTASPELWRTLAVVFGLNFGAQITIFLGVTRFGRAEAAPALAVIGGNRNLALFLGALPANTASDLLLFIGCYQVPMYVTPLVMAPLMRLLKRRMSDMPS